MKIKKILTILLWTVILFSFNNRSIAESPEGYIVDPTIIELKGKPGETIEETLTILNTRNNPVDVNLDIRDFMIEEERIIYKDPGPIAFSPSTWTKFEKESFLLKPNNVKKVKLIVTIPKEAEMGEHVTLGIVKFLSPNNSSNINVAIEILPVIYISVTDEDGNINLNKSWELVKFSSNYFNNGFVNFSIKNTGNVHLEPYGNVELRNIFTKEKQDIPIQRRNILAGVTKDLSAYWTTDDWIGIYKVHSTLKYDENNIIEKNTLFFVIPWVDLLMIILLLLIIIIIIRIYLKRLKRRIYNEAKKDLTNIENPLNNINENADKKHEE